MDKQGPLFYEALVEWKGGRKGDLRSQNLPTLEVAAPPEFQGHEGIWTPEHFFVASVNACFMTTFLAIAANSKLEFVSFSSEAKGRLERVEKIGYQLTEIQLRPRLTIRQPRDLERAARVLEMAEKNCFISNSIKSVVKLEPQVFHQQDPAYPCPPMPDPCRAERGG